MGCAGVSDGSGRHRRGQRVGLEAELPAEEPADHRQQEEEEDFQESLVAWGFLGVNHPRRQTCASQSAW